MDEKLNCAINYKLSVLEYQFEDLTKKHAINIVNKLNNCDHSITSLTINSCKISEQSRAPIGSRRGGSHIADT